MLDISSLSLATFLPMMLSWSFKEIVRKAREPQEKALSSALVGVVSTDGMAGERFVDGGINWFFTLSSGVESDSVEWRSHKLVLLLTFVGVIGDTHPSSDVSRLLEVLAGSVTAATPRECETG